MVNGTLSRILYIGALILVAICLVGTMAMASAGQEFPGDAKMILYTCLGFLFGTHVMPPTVKKVVGTAARVVGAEPETAYVKDGKGSP